MRSEIQPVAFDCYQSPRTRAPLVRRGDALASLDGTESFAIVNGIPQLRQGPLPDSEAPFDDQLRRMCERADQVGWRAALEETRSNWDYVLDSSRLVILDIVPIREGDHVLEIGSALGQMTGELARRASRVQGLEIRPGQAEFALKRCQEEGAQNVSIACGGDQCLLPLKDQQFDVVVMNLVFEWCAREMDETPFEEGQNRLLREVSRVLRPGGIFYLSTKNRFALRLLLGKPDEHVGKMRFGNALPRWLMRRRLRSRGLKRPGGLLHSYPALVRKIQQSGFHDIAGYWLVPEMRRPRWITPSTREGVRALRAEAGVVQGEFRSTALLMRFIPATLVKYVTPGLTFVARKLA